MNGGIVRHPIAAILALGSVSCGLVDPDTRRIVGFIDADPSSTIEAPDTVRLGLAFAATVNSFGSSGCTTPDGVKLTLGPAEARVIPFDRVPADNSVACPGDVSPRPHPVELHFTELGTATIVAEGMTHGENGERVRGTVAKAIVVVP
jgi:hypothetical protein